MADDEDHSRKIPKLRETFAELFAGSLNSNVYDERDIDRVRLDDEHVRAYLRHQKGNIEKAANMMDLVLKWRKDLHLNDLSDKSFPRELHEMGAVYWHSEDNKGQKILYFSVKKNKKDPEKLPLIKQFVAWHIEKQFRENPDKKIVALLDMTDAGFGNMDMDLIKYQISCFTTYFPGLLAYMLIFEMPWVLNAIWKVIKTLLSAEQQKAVIFVKRNEVQKYIEPAKLFKHMGGLDGYEYTYIPSEDSGIELANGDMETPTEEDELFSMSVEYTSSALAAAKKRRVTFSESESVVYTSIDNDSVSLVSDDGDGRCQSNNNNASLNSVPRRTADEDNTFVSSLLTIVPAEELEFCPTEENRDSLDIISLTNITDKHVAYKVKTTSPEKYRVRPSTGVIQPNGHADINVCLHSVPVAGVTKDKFLIMFMEVEPEVPVSQVNELFKVTGRDNYNEHRLRCRLGSMKVVSDSPLLSSSKTSATEQLNKLSQQTQTGPLLPIPSITVHPASECESESDEVGDETMVDLTSVKSRPAEVDSVSMVSGLSGTHSELLEIWQEEYDEMETLLTSHQRLEWQMGQLRKYIFLLLGIILLFLLTIFLTYWTEYLPVNKYTVNACVPHYL